MRALSLFVTSEVTKPYHESAEEPSCVTLTFAVLVVMLSTSTASVRSWLKLGFFYSSGSSHATKATVANATIDIKAKCFTSLIACLFLLFYRALIVVFVEIDSTLASC